MSKDNNKQEYAYPSNQSLRMFIGGLSVEVTKGLCKGYGFITCDDSTTFRRIMKQREHRINGRIIDCNIACKKTDAPESIKNLKKKKIFVGGLSHGTLNDDLRNYFLRFGVVKKAYIIKDYKTGKSKNFGFVEFDSEKSAKSAVDFQEHYLNGQKLTCNAFKEDKRTQKAKNQGKRSKLDDLLGLDMGSTLSPLGQYPQTGGSYRNNFMFNGYQQTQNFNYCPYPQPANWSATQLITNPHPPVHGLYPQNLNFPNLTGSEIKDTRLKSNNLPVGQQYPQGNNLKGNYSLFGGYNDKQSQQPKEDIGMFACYSLSDNEEESLDQESSGEEEGGEAKIQNFEAVKKTIDLIMFDE